MGIEDQLAKSGDAMRSHAESSAVPAAGVVLARAQRRRRIGAGVVAGVVLLGLGGTAMALRPEPSSQIAVAADTTDPGSTTTGVPTTVRPPTTPTGPSTTTTVVPGVTVPPTTADTTITYETGPTLHTVPDTTVPETSAPDTTVPVTTVWETTTTPPTTIPFFNQPMQLDASVTVVNSTTLRVAVSGKDEDAPMPDGQVYIHQGFCSPVEVVAGSEASLYGRYIASDDPLLVARRFLDGTDSASADFCGVSLLPSVALAPGTPTPVSQCRPDCTPLDTSMDIAVPGPGVYTVRVSVISGLADGSDGIFRSMNTVTKEVTVPA